MRKILSLFAVLGLAASLFAETLPSFTEKWSDEEISLLQNGSFVIRNIKRVKKISIQSGTNAAVDKMLSVFEETNPNYLAEIIYKLPVAGNEQIFDQAARIFSDPALYREIIYTDEREDLVQPLFNEVDIHEQSTSGNSTYSTATLKLDMLSDFDVELITQKDEDSFFFLMNNTTPIKWKSLNAVKPKKLLAVVTAFICDGSYYVYALSGVRAPKIPILWREIDYQFMTRINGFSLFFLNKFDIKR